jgi:hypothetical protein
MGHGMQWYVYLITIPAVLFLWQVAIELVGRPIKTILRLRRCVLARLAAFRNMPLPGPRELAVSSREIRAYDQAMQNVREAERTFAELGDRLLAFCESEPTIRTLMALGGVDIVLAGHELISLSQTYAAAKIDSGKLRCAIEEAHQAARCALAVPQRRSGDDELTKIRIEPMHLHDSASRRRRRPLGRPQVIFPLRPSRARPVSRPAAGVGK